MKYKKPKERMKINGDWYKSQHDTFKTKKQCSDFRKKYCLVTAIIKKFSNGYVLYIPIGLKVYRRKK